MNGVFDSPQIIWWMIGFCVLFMAFMIFPSQLKVLFKIILQGAAGMLAIFALNFIAAPLGFSVGINFITAAFVGLLGIPGIATLYIFRIFL